MLNSPRITFMPHTILYRGDCPPGCRNAAGRPPGRRPGARPRRLHCRARPRTARYLGQSALRRPVGPAGRAARRPEAQSRAQRRGVSCCAPRYISFLLSRRRRYRAWKNVEPAPLLSRRIPCGREQASCARYGNQLPAAAPASACLWDDSGRVRPGRKPQSFYARVRAARRQHWPCAAAERAEPSVPLNSARVPRVCTHCSAGAICACFCVAKAVTPLCGLRAAHWLEARP